MSNIGDYKDSIEDWAKMWDKAQEDKSFQDAPSHGINQSTATQSFFGYFSANPSEKIADVDADYWKKVNDLTHLNMDPSDVLQEMFNSDADVSKATRSANPINAGTVGKDQDLEPTFTEDDFDKWEEIKRKIHDVGSKIAEAQATGKAISGPQSELDKLSKQLDDLSDQISSGSKKGK